MDSQRLILFLVFSFSLLFLWEAWQKHVNPPPPVTTTKQAAPNGAAKPADVPSATPAGSAPGATGAGAVPGVPGQAT